MTVRPTIALAGGYLFIASNDALVEDALAVKAGTKSGLKSTDEFKHLAKDMPTAGNRYAYISQRFGQTYMQIQQQVMSMRAAQEPAMSKLMQQFINPDNAKNLFYVSATTDEGWVGMGNGNANGAVMAATMPVAVIAVGIAMPLAMAKMHAAQRNALQPQYK
jgi:hypothetical protein